ncbi:MAG TPA: response regulator, partial [Gemmatimonadaceae bacterium]|nr:response regulator [Gemmatimonadaceae bacterium]
QPERAPGGSETVLLLEDAPAVRTAVRRMLASLGYAVLAPPSSEEALEIMNSTGVNVLMTDVVMPGMSGRELAEKFMEKHPNGRVLYMSGYTDDAVLRHGVLSSEVAFIQKPFTKDAVARKLRAVIDQKDQPVS